MAWLLPLAAAAATAADEVRPSTIEPVTVYPGLAVVERSAKVGADARELVRVQVTPAQQRNSSAGFIGNRAERRMSRVYGVENRHDSAIELRASAPLDRKRQHG